MISTQLVILLLTVAALAFYAGFQFGRQASNTVPARTAENDRSEREDPISPLPVPRPFEPARPRSAPPPASASGGSSADVSTGPSNSSRSAPHGEPRRTSAPPPARAGLLDPGSNQKK